MIRISALSLLALTACEQPNETVASYGGDGIWSLVSIDEIAFEAKAIMQLEASGAVSGRAPCNSYRARQTAPYPWFEIDAVIATKAACPELAAEQQFFEALSAMSLSEVSGDVLVLSNDAGRNMVFDKSSSVPEF